MSIEEHFKEMARMASVREKKADQERITDEKLNELKFIFDKMKDLEPLSAKKIDEVWDYYIDLLKVVKEEADDDDSVNFGKLTGNVIRNISAVGMFYLFLSSEPLSYNIMAFKEEWSKSIETGLRMACSLMIKYKNKADEFAEDEVKE